MARKKTHTVKATRSARGSPRGSRTLRISLDIGENDKDPAQFRDCVVLAEKLGFDRAWLGDHFMPWVHAGNRSAYAWSLLGACLQSTKKIQVGPFVTTPIGARYHPAIVAQASATLDNMFPGRFLLSVGTGEAMNEFPFFGGWPPWQERMDRLVEGIEVIRKMWNSTSYFDHEGRYFPLKQVYLYTRPRTKMKVYFSAVGPKSATYAGRYGDGLVTLSSHNSIEKIRDVIIRNLEEGTRSAGRNPKELEKIVSISFYVGSENGFFSSQRVLAGIIAKGSYNEPDPRKIEQMGSAVSKEELLRSSFVTSKWSDVIDLISKYEQLGADEVVLPSGCDPKTIRTYAAKILSHFR